MDNRSNWEMQSWMVGWGRQEEVRGLVEGRRCDYGHWVEVEEMMGSD